MTKGTPFSQLNAEDKHELKVNAIKKIVEDFEHDAIYEHARADTNFDMFINGSKFEGKQDWQADFTIPKWERSIRAAHANIKNKVLNHHDFYDFEAYNKDDSRLADILDSIKKGVNYNIEISNSKEKIGRSILAGLIYQAHCYVGWKDILLLNPSYVDFHTKKNREKIRESLSKITDNPPPNPIAQDPDEVDIINSIQAGMSKLYKNQPNEVKEIEPPQYLRMGTFDIITPNPKDVGFDMNMDLFKDSKHKFFKLKVHRWQLKAEEKKGIFSNVDKVINRNVKDYINDIRVKNRASTISGDDRVELIYYYGSLVVNGVEVYPNYSCVIADRSVILRESVYPFWEPLDKKTPISSLAVKEVPGKAGGAGASDHGVKLQKHFDGMWHMSYDQALRTMAGLTLVEYNALVDKSILERGVNPGEHVEVRGNPKEKVAHVDLSSNLENQVKPAAEVVRQGIEDAGGLSALTYGGAQLRSRTTKAEVDQRANADSVSIDDMSSNIADYLAEIIHTMVARFLQFGIDELKTNKNLQAIYDPIEIELLQSLSVEERIQILNGGFKVRIKGFLGQAQKADAIAKINELLFMANNPSSPIASMLPLQSVLEAWFNLQDMSDIGLKLDLNNETSRVYAENQILANNQFLQVSPNDKHQAHIQSHIMDQRVMQTQAGQEHIMEHQAMMQQLEQAQQQPNQPSLPAPQPQLTQ